MPSSSSPPCVYGRPLLQLAREIGVHLATLHRWRDPGVLGADGSRRRLRMVKVGGRWHVRDDDLASFFAALSDGRDGVRVGASKLDMAASAKEQERIGRALDADGF